MKKLKKIPKFKNEKEERDFWDKHSAADFEDELEVVKDLKFAPPRSKDKNDPAIHPKEVKKSIK